MNLLLLVVGISSLFIVEGRSGVDISVPSTKKGWECLIDQYNVSFAIIRAYRSIGVVDGECANSLNVAFAAGVNDLDVYFFPCIQSSAYSSSHNITCLSPKEQVGEVVAYLNKNNIGFGTETGKLSVGRVWIDVEDENPPRYYDLSPTVNQNFMSELVTAWSNNQVNIGIYSTKTYWTSIMGGTNEYSIYPLWYPRYDGVSSMDFFSPFAGWDKATIKQLQGDVDSSCSISVDVDYMED